MKRLPPSLLLITIRLDCFLINSHPVSVIHQRPGWNDGADSPAFDDAPCVLFSLPICPDGRRVSLFHTETDEGGRLELWWGAIETSSRFIESSARKGRFFAQPGKKSGYTLGSGFRIFFDDIVCLQKIGIHAGPTAPFEKAKQLHLNNNSAS